MTSSPRVSLAMPVYNGAETIAESIESLLAQSYGDFELVISDNASTDTTVTIAQGYAVRDSRIRILRQPVNIGANRNYTAVARAARGEYLKWASASDWCAPTLVERCVEALDRAPEAVLAASRTRLFEGDRACAQDYDRDLALPAAAPSQRFIDLVSKLALNNAINGLIRMSALRRTRLIDRYYGADLVLMGHLALLGTFLLIEEPLYYRRMEPASSTALMDEAGKREHHFPQQTRRAQWQGWKRFAGWWFAGLRAPMPIAERLRTLDHIARMTYWERRALWEDLRRAVPSGR